MFRFCNGSRFHYLQNFPFSANSDIFDSRTLQTTKNTPIFCNSSGHYSEHSRKYFFLFQKKKKKIKKKP